MEKEKNSYTVINNLDMFINKEIGRRMLEDGVKVLKKEIIQEISEFTNVGWGNISMIKRGKITPSLPVALRIAEYFNVKVEDIFKIS